MTLAQLGIDAATLQGDGHPLHFTLRHDAGTFTFSGSANRGLAIGTFRFTPDQTYVKAFGALRGTPLTPRQEVMAGMFDLRLAYVEAVVESGLRNTSFDDLVGLKMFGVTAADVKSIREDFPSADAGAIKMVRMMKGDPERMHELHLLLPGADLMTVMGLPGMGITPAYVKALQKAGVRDLTGDNVLALTVAGVSQAFADHLASQGPYGLTVDEVARLAKQTKLEASP